MLQVKPRMTELNAWKNMALSLTFRCMRNNGFCFRSRPIYQYRRATWGGAFGAFASPEIFKTLHRNYDNCRNFQRIKIKFYILIISKKSYWKFSLSCSLIISLQDLSWDRLSDRKFRKWLVLNHKYAGTDNLGDSFKCSYFLSIFYPFVRVLFCLRQASVWPYETL